MDKHYPYALGFLAAILLTSIDSAWAVDVTPIVNSGLDWTNGILLTLSTIVSGFVVRWLSATTGLKNAEMERVLASQLNDILHRAIGIAYATAKAKVNDPHNTAFTDIKFDNVFIAMAANYAVQAAPGIIAKFGITRDRLEQMVVARLPDWIVADSQISASQATILDATAKRQVDAAEKL